MKQFKIRCSAIGQIMTNARSKTAILSKTTETYLQDWTKEQLYGRRKQFSNKYTDKGLVVEDDSLDYVAEVLGYDSLIKNDKFFKNDFLMGTPDAILSDHLIDVKNSWDCFTFPLWANEVPSKDYYWQAQGYMALTGLKKYKLIYVLMDTPEHLIEREYKYNNSLELDYYEFEKDYIYNSINSKYRVKVFEIEKNDEDIEKIYARVEECRMYINNLNK